MQLKKVDDLQHTSVKISSQLVLCPVAGIILISSLICCVGMVGRAMALESTHLLDSG